ncbi:hypothetical protein [Paenibacillus sp. MMS20-IR301]|uniref:nuclear transport factor 2 family protein n=1 Tax=Paenibacillus sp. MMS20-IR301 TaxID=2895946 RepID=UPI0028E1B5C7|nr:hypothetical protein [Paenibacillus sp. MMS20-IR301]WNS46286.1 hypothetical protein LOS79_13795 [Paenibacillus sp. MMS20-IR301]
MKLQTVTRFFELTEQFKTDEADYAQILHPEIEQTEFPNALTPQLTVSDRELLFKRMPGGRKLLSSQKYDIQHTYEAGNTLIAEVVWSAVVAVDAGAFKAGQELKAYFCCVFEFKDNLIHRQRNYDCFERFQ